MPPWIVIAIVVVIVLALQSISVRMGLFPKLIFVPVLEMGGLLAVAAYYHSWWIVMCAFFWWIYMYMRTEFLNIRESFARMEDKLERLEKSSVSSSTL